MNKEYQICNRCVMDTSDPEIVFDDKGNCNHCNDYFAEESKYVKYGEAGKKELNQIISQIKKDGKRKKYDCLIGLSGGVDSSYVAYLVKHLGLRPLAVHFDNGWNSELAVKNIENIVRKLDIDLYTHVCNWEEMKDLQLSYFKAGVINADIPMDHAFTTVLHNVALKNNIKYFFSGQNYETEKIIPQSWVYNSRDLKNLLDIQKKHGSVKLKNYPTESLLKNVYVKYLSGLKQINILDYYKYNKLEAMNIIEKEVGWKYYGGKHYESIFTRFYQGYYLKERFGVDKRIAHLSTLICSNQMTRNEALKELEKSPYPEPELLKKDKIFIPKKLGISQEEFEKILKSPTRSHYHYNTDEKIRNFLQTNYQKWAKKLLSK